MNNVSAIESNLLNNDITGNQRFVSALIDYLPILVLSCITMGFFFYEFIAFMNKMPFSRESADNQTEILNTTFIFIEKMLFYASINIIITYGYLLCKDLFGGQSIGKRNKGLQLVRCKSHEPVSNIRMVIRNIFCMFWFIELIMIFANPRQRLGDIVCDTTVVAANESNKQLYDKKKVIFTIIIVLVIITLFSYLYYKGMSTYFNFYFKMIEQSNTFQ